ncbi:LptE family protein [bacterium]|nr:LptE family protein [candidate division CSSED10-310 bacterium]
MKPSRRYRIFPVLAILAGCAVWSGCGYHLAGQGNSLPPHIKKITVPMFQNKTYEYGLETIITVEVIDAFDRRAGIDIVKSVEQADAVVEGEIIEYKFVPTLNSQRQVTQYYINITASVRLRDLIQDSVYWENPRFNFHEIYKVTGGLSSIQNNRQQAWQDAAEDFAESLSSVLLEGF